MKNASKNKLINGKFYIILFIFCEFANRFVALRKIWVVKGIVPVVEGLNIINLYAMSLGQNSRYVELCVQYEKLE